MTNDQIPMTNERGSSHLLVIGAWSLVLRLSFWFRHSTLRVS